MTRHSQQAVPLTPGVREAFDAACLAVFDHRPGNFAFERESNVLLVKFADTYRQLSALPRRSRRTLVRRWKYTLGAIALLLTLGTGTAWAATLQVSAATPPAINSDGRCSLIEAIVNANRDARIHLDCVAGQGGDTIVLPRGSRQSLRPLETLPPITSRIAIEGRDSTIRRSTSQPSYQPFFRITATGDLTLNQTTITGATPSGVPGGFGGIDNAGGKLTLHGSAVRDTSGTAGIVNSGTATLEDSTVSGNGIDYPDSYTGGGIINRDGGTMVLRNSTVTGNGAVFHAGGIANGKGSSLTLIDSEVSENWITYEGRAGGISNSGTLVLVGSTVSGNTADFGGGIHNFESGVARLTRSTVSKNTAWNVYGYAMGGGIQNWGQLILTNSTVSQNKADYGAGLNLEGDAATISLVSSTVTGNVARYEGGGLVVHSGTLTLRRSIVSGNVANAGDEINNAPYSWAGTGGAVVANDFNLIGHAGDAGVLGFTTGSTDLVPLEPIGDILLPLADNGGNTWTHALAIGSPALDASPDDATCPAVDQRQNLRPKGRSCDIGAFEGSAVLCGGRVTTMVGTDGVDELTGTPGDDVISGLNGNDAIGGLGGNDVICGGAGADALFGGAGNDVLLGQGGNDRLFGHNGDDTLDGGAGIDQCDGGGHSAAGDSAVACETVTKVP